MHLITPAFVASMAINLLMFIPAYIFQTDRLTDISYSITFVTLAVFGYALSSRDHLHLLILLLVLLWACRLGGFLFLRINKVGKDVRFDGMRESFSRFLKFWVLQGVSVFVIMLAALLGFAQTNTRISTLSLAGVVIFIFGLIVETAADAQKFRFKNNPANKGKWIDLGVWRASRHPNYLGEISVWVGVFLVVASSLSLTGILIALLSPLFIMSLLLFVSGIPLLEKSAREKWGGQQQFQTYLREVPLLIPTARSIRRIFKTT